MSKFVRCDGCGAEFSFEDWEGGTVNNGEGDAMDLCPECCKEYTEEMNKARSSFFNTKHSKDGGKKTEEPDKPVDTNEPKLDDEPLTDYEEKQADADEQSDLQGGEPENTNSYTIDGVNYSNTEPVEDPEPVVYHDDYN